MSPKQPTAEQLARTAQADRSNRFAVTSGGDWTTEEIFAQVTLELWWMGFGLDGKEG